MKTSKHGYTYCEMEDVKEICGKCRFSYNGDWNIQDCFYCPLPKVIEVTKTLTQKLEICEENLDAIAEGLIYE